MRNILRVDVPWMKLEDDRHPYWQADFCLYAYLHPERDWLLYIGKADWQTVRRRLHGDHKAQIFDYFRQRYGIDQVRVFQGDIVLESGRRRSSELLGLVESLLIMRLQPSGNIGCTSSRCYRPGLRVRCTGEWPFKRTRFSDWN
jgi:hypothetical protein